MRVLPALLLALVAASGGAAGRRLHQEASSSCASNAKWDYSKCWAASEGRESVPVGGRRRNASRRQLISQFPPDSQRR